MQDLLKDFLNWLSSPTIFFTLACIGWVLLMKYYRKWTNPKFMIPVFIFSVIALVWSLMDPNFFIQASKPDNIPIWIMAYATGYFVWLSFRRAAINDALDEEGKPNLEKQESNQKVYTWPDLVYSELICMVLFLAFLFAWAVIFQAPLEEPANTGVTPNPAKAPWYFLGLQEMLVYFDPWMAGVVMPVMIIVGLVALPYYDDNPKGNGYYTVKDRFSAIWVFGFGFIVLWIALIFLGTFFRGPSWNTYGPFEYWDKHKVLVMNNINLSELFWVKLLHTKLPTNPFVREFLGIGLTLGYMVAIPPILSKTFLKNYYQRLGFTRYNIVVILGLVMLSLPIKMYLRWFINLKYIVALPEYVFNI